jgi:hypothetical protein
MADLIINIIAFLGCLFGVAIVQITPFIQKQIARVKTLEVLEWKKPYDLTDDDRWFIDKMNEPFKFKKQYIWTAIGGFIGALIVVFTSFSSLTEQNAGNDLFAILINSVFIGMGGNWLGNQLIKSENLASLATNMKSSSTVSGIISDSRPQKGGIESEPEKKVESEPEKKVESQPPIIN